MSKDIKRDIVVIGGGIAGLLVAYCLTEKGKKVTFIEAKKIYNGVTSKTTAHLTAQQENLFHLQFSI